MNRRPDNACLGQWWHRCHERGKLLEEPPFSLPDFQAIAYFLDGGDGFRY